MPLIALEILESKIKELLIVTNHLKSENELLRKQLSAGSPDQVSAEISYELDKMKKLLAKYKGERSVIHSKISNAVSQINDIIKRDKNG